MVSPHSSRNIPPALLAQADQLEAAQDEFASASDSLVADIEEEFAYGGTGRAGAENRCHTPFSSEQR